MSDTNRFSDTTESKGRMSDSTETRSRPSSRPTRARTRSLSLQKRAASTHRSPLARMNTDLPEQFRNRRSPQLLASSSEESLDLTGLEDVGQMETYNEEMAAVRKQVESMRTDLAECKMALLFADKDVSRLTLVLDTKVEELEALRKKHEELRESMQKEKESLLQLIDEGRDDLEMTNEILKSKKAENEALCKQIEGLEVANERMRAEIEALKTGSAQEASLFSATKKALEGATTYQDELQAVADEYQRKHEANERKIAQLTIEVDDGREDYEILFGKYKKQNEQLQKLKSFYDRSVEDLRELRSKSHVVSLADFERARKARGASPGELVKTHTKPAMMASHSPSKKELKAKDFPKQASDMSFTVYLQNLQNYIDYLLETGYEDADVAEGLFKALSQGSLSSPFLHRYKREKKPDTMSTEFLMETLSKVDFAFRNLRPEDRFRVIRRRPRESHVDFLQRVEREYDAVYPDETTLFIFFTLTRVVHPFPFLGFLYTPSTLICLAAMHFRFKACQL